MLNAYWIYLCIVVSNRTRVYE